MKEKIYVPIGKTIEDVISLEPVPFEEGEPCDEEEELEAEYE